MLSTYLPVDDGFVLTVLAGGPSESARPPPFAARCKSLSRIQHETRGVIDDLPTPYTSRREVDTPVWTDG